MDLRTAMKAQYHAGLAMLADCVEKCPDAVWMEGKHPRLFWRIAFHAAFFTHLYLGQDEAAFQRWPGCKPGDHWKLFEVPAELEPYELPEDAPAYTQGELLDYIRFVDGLVDETVDGLDLETKDTGFHWYAKMGKLSHQLMNLRHIQGHVGQLSELLMAKDIDTDWISRSADLDLDRRSHTTLDPPLNSGGVPIHSRGISRRKMRLQYANEAIDFECLSKQVFFTFLYLIASYLVIAPLAVWSYLASKRTKHVWRGRVLTAFFLLIPILPYLFVELQTAVALPELRSEIRSALTQTYETAQPCYMKVLSYLGDESSVLVVLPEKAKSGQTVGTVGMVYELHLGPYGWEFQDRWSCAWSYGGSADGNVFPPYPEFWTSSQWTILGVALAFFVVAASIVFWGVFSLAASLGKGDHRDP